MPFIFLNGFLLIFLTPIQDYFTSDGKKREKAAVTSSPNYQVSCFSVDAKEESQD